MNSKRDREELRPLIRDTRLYHASDRPDGAHWDGVEYWVRRAARVSYMCFADRSRMSRSTGSWLRGLLQESATGYTSRAAA